MNRFFSKLHSEYDWKEVKQRYKISLLIQFGIIVSIPWFLALTFPYQNYSWVNFFRDNYGLVTVLAVPLYLLALSTIKDELNQKATLVYFITGWNFLFNYMISTIISDAYLDINLSNLLSNNFTFFNNLIMYDLFVDLTIAPIIVLYSLFGYLVLSRTMFNPNLLRPKK